MIPPKKFFLSFLLLSTPLLIGSWVYVGYVQEEPESPQWKELERKIHFQIKHFPGKAGIFIYDLTRGWTIAHNAEELFPSASLVKVPMMAAIYEAQAKGRISLEEALPIQRRLKASGSGQLKYVKPGRRFTVRELLYKMITESDNTATNMLTDYFGLDFYNEHFLKLGLTRTNFSRYVMDLKKRSQGIENYTTPKDMAKLLELIYRKKLTGSDEMLEILKAQKINDRLASAIPSDWEIGHKTGLMWKTCHDVGIVFAPAGDYVICVLTSGATSYRRSKNFISEIAYLTTLYYGAPSLYPRQSKSFWTKIWSKNKHRSL